MATRTRYYQLTKPDGTDLVNIDDLNGNFDVIDTKLKEHADGKQDKLTFDDALLMMLRGQEVITP